MNSGNCDFPEFQIQETETMKKTIVIVTAILTIAVLTVFILTSCGSKKNSQSVEVNPVSSPTPTSMAVPTPAVTEIPVVITTPTPEPSETPTPKPSPTPMPTPTATPKPTATPTPLLPVIKKSPTDETVDEGGSCYFVAKFENATIAVWHFISPDGHTDLTYEAAQKEFETMEIINGMYSTMQLKNIPYAANGWRVYCRYSNNNGYSDTKTALITVKANPNPTPSPSPSTSPVPIVTGFAGTWAEEIAGRGTVTIKEVSSGTYDIAVHWGNGADEKAVWTMTAQDIGNGVLAYTDCVKEIWKFSSEGDPDVERVYDDGSGFFTLSDDVKLIWASQKGDVSLDTRFIFEHA